MKTWIMNLALGVLILATGCQSASPKNEAARPDLPVRINGTFVSLLTSTARLELRGDGTFAIQEPGTTASGTYNINGTVVALHVSGGQTAVLTKFDGKGFLDTHGSPWARQ